MNLQKWFSTMQTQNAGKKGQVAYS